MNQEITQWTTGRWWDSDEGSLPTALAGWAAYLESFDFERRTKNLVYARLATNRDLPNIYGLALTRSSISALDFREWKAPVFNVVGSSVETLTNKVGRNKPWILFLTDGGDFSARMTGKKKSRFIDGVWHETQTYRLSRQMFTDALTYGDGFIKASPSADGKRIVHDVILGDELLVDPWDALYFGKWPRSLIHRTFMSRGELLAIYGDDPEMRMAIETAPGSFQGPMWFGMTSSSHTSMVAVLEGWKLPEPDGTPGRHVLTISDRIALVDEKYTRKRYPFVKLSCVSAGRGFWNIGIPEILGSFQANINKTQQVIDQCFPAGTPVDGRPIETIRPGDIVSCVDHTTGAAVRRQVLRTFEKRHAAMVTLRAGKVVLTCTDNHPILVAGRGYIAANDVHDGDLLCVRRGVSTPTGQGEQDVFSPLSAAADVAHQDGGQPDVAQGIAGQGGGDASADRPQAKERPVQLRADASGISSGECAGSTLAIDAGHSDEGQAGARVRVSDLLQSGFGGHDYEDLYRGRWSEPQVAEGAHDGREEDCVLEWTRVESVSRDERGGSDGIAVYNLEVEGAHTYFANGVLVHNCQDRMAAGRWLVPTGSGVTDDALGRKAAGIIRHQPGMPPTFITPQAVPPELYRHLEDTIERAYKRVGISELAAQAMKPAGLNSGEALRAFESAESERYVTLGMQLEDAMVDLAELDLELAAAIQPRVKAPYRGGIDVIDWNDLKGLKDDKAILKAFPVSSLPTSPAGRLQRAAEMFQTGQISKDDYLRLIDYPDTDAVIELNTASRDAIDWMLDRIVEDGTYECPEPYMDLNMAMTVAQNRYLRERIQGCPEDRLEDLRRFMESCKQLQAKAQAPAAAPQINPAQAQAAGLPPPQAPVIGTPTPGGPEAGTSQMPVAA